MRVLQHHLEIVAEAAKRLPVEKRAIFLQRIKARLQLYGYCPSDDELNAAIGLAMTGLIQQPQQTA